MSYRDPVSRPIRFTRSMISEGSSASEPHPPPLPIQVTVWCQEPQQSQLPGLVVHYNSASDTGTDAGAWGNVKPWRIERCWRLPCLA